MENAGLVVEGTVDRSRLWAAQTPQVFRAEALRAALAVDAAMRDAATDEAMLVEAAGGTVLIHPAPAGEPQGDDAARSARRRAAARAPSAVSRLSRTQTRVAAKQSWPTPKATPRLTAPSSRGDRGAAGEGEQEESSWRPIARCSLGCQA